MDEWLLANVGQRDLYVNGRAPETPKKGMTDPAINVLPLRRLGEQILNEYEAQRGRLSAPMLEVALQHIFASRPGASPRVVLFATDQADEHHRNNDTLVTAQVLARWLPERFPALAGVEVRAIRDSPQDYDLMLKEFERLVPRADETGPDAVVYVEISGGTPACNMALTLTAIRRFRERCRQIYVSERGQWGELALGRTVLDSYRAEAAERMLASYDFAGVADLYGDEPPGRLAAYAVARGNLDLEGAERILEGLAGQFDGPMREAYDAICGRGKGLRQGCPAAQLEELFWHLKIKLARGEYADALGRLFRLDESLMAAYVEKHFGIRTRPQEGGDKWRPYIQSVQRWLGLYERLYGKGSNLKPESGPNRMVYRKMLSNAAELVEAGCPIGHNVDPADLRKFSDLLKKMEKVGDLRNRTLAGHDFKGVSLQAIEQAANMPINEVLDRYVELLKWVGADVRTRSNPFDDVREMIRACLAQAAKAREEAELRKQGHLAGDSHAKVARQHAHEHGQGA